MTDQNRARPSIDLDELERQLREAAGPRAAPAPSPASSQSPKEDPLAELARIVGSDDPYRSFWPQGGNVPSSSQGGKGSPQMAPPRSAPGQQEPFEDELAALARNGGRSYEDPLSPEMQQRAPHAAVQHDDERAYQELASRSVPYDPDQLAPMGDGSETYANDDIDYRGPAPRRSRKALVAVIAVLALAGIGVGAAVMGRGTGGIRLAGAPPVITAETGPSKVQPENPGGTVVPNQDRQIYNKQTTEDTKTAKVVTGEEQPMDVVAAAKRDAPRVVLPSTGAAPSAATSTSTSGIAAQAPKPEAQSTPGVIPGLGEPRRVKTVSVRPDGSVIDGQTGEPAAPPAGARLMSVTQASSLPTPAAAPTAEATAPKPDAAPTRTASTTTTSGPTPVPAPRPRTETTGSTPTTTAAVPAAPAPKPAAPRVTTTQAQPTQVASTQPIVPQPVEQSAASGSGGWAVQLAGSPSEPEAKSTATRLQARFSSELGGAAPSVVKADVNGKTLYRVRVLGMTKDDATALCSRLVAAGGVCFVAKS